jgi:hypothetical protein
MTGIEESHTRYCFRRNRETAFVALGFTLLMVIASAYRLQHPLHRVMAAWDYAGYFAGAVLLVYLMHVLRCRGERVLLGLVAAEQLMKPFVSELPISTMQTFGRLMIVLLWVGATISSAALVADPTKKN